MKRSYICDTVKYIYLNKLFCICKCRRMCALPCIKVHYHNFISPQELFQLLCQSVKQVQRS